MNDGLFWYEFRKKMADVAKQDAKDGKTEILIEPQESFLDECPFSNSAKRGISLAEKLLAEKFNGMKSGIPQFLATETIHGIPTTFCNCRVPCKQNSPEFSRIPYRRNSAKTVTQQDIDGPWRIGGVSAEAPWRIVGAGRKLSVDQHIDEAGFQYR